MSPALILSCICGYFAILLLIAWATSRHADEDAYFSGNRKSPWLAVAFGLIADSLSGVTFISVPGAVGTGGFGYMQLVLGYFVGYWVIAYLLIPLYYRLNLTSIYGYLGQRLGPVAEKTGSFFFILSRTVGAAGRLFITAAVIQLFVFDQLHVPFELSVSVIIGLILVYTFKGGIKTLVWTDVFQSSFLLLGVVLSIAAIVNQLDVSAGTAMEQASNAGYTRFFNWDLNHKHYFWKQFIGGMFVAIAMSGLDQNMMQKQLSCKTAKDAGKNLVTFSFVVIVVNLCFLALGALLYLYQTQEGVEIPIAASGKPDTDKLFPLLALNHLGSFAGLAFIIGLTAATFSSADSVLTTLTTSVYVDFLNLEKRTDLSAARKKSLRHAIHIGFAALLLIVILLFRAYKADAIIDTILAIASYTYGPLLGLFAFGLFTRRSLMGWAVPLVCVAAPAGIYFLNEWFKAAPKGYQFGQELLILNGIFTFVGLLLISRRGTKMAA